MKSFKISDAYREEDYGEFEAVAHFAAVRKFLESEGFEVVRTNRSPNWKVYTKTFGPKEFYVEKLGRLGRGEFVKVIPTE